MKPLSDEELDNVIDYMESHDMVTVEDGKRLIATIRERDKRIAELQAKVVDCDMAYAEGQLSAVDDAALRSHDDTHRAEAFTLYNSLITRGWGDGDKAAFASRAAAAIEAASVFNEKWEKRNG